MNVLREKRGEIDQETIAQLIGVDRATISKWENGKFMPRADKLPKLAKILNCSVDELLNIS